MTDRFLVNYIHIYVCSCLFANWQEECSSKYKSVSPILVNNVKFGNSSVVTQLVCGSLEVTQRKIQSEIHRQMAKSVHPMGYLNKFLHLIRLFLSQFLAKAYFFTTFEFKIY